MTDFLRKMFKPQSKDGEVRTTSKAARWARVRADMQSAFPTYYDEEPDTFAQDVTYAIKKANDLKPAKDGPPYLGDEPAVPDYNGVTEVELDEHFGDLKGVIQESVELFNGMPHWAHPQTMCNVIPPGNKAGIIGAMLANVFCPNIIEGEYSWNVMKAEMESAAMLSKLIGWDPTVAGGIYTYGGSGCYFYGMKYALTSVLGQQSRCTGIRTDGKILTSQQGHYCKQNSSDWLGLGMNNIVDIETDDRTNEMDMADLEETMVEYQSQGIPIIAIVCTMGTTDAFAVDPVDKVRALVEKHPNPEGYGPPFIYCDAVIGWSWLTFGGYDFNKNPLGFSDDVLPLIRRNYHKLSKVKYADAVGTDFHKTGWAPYNCSMFMMKDLQKFRTLMTRPGSAYLQERTCYNPGLYTLEVSRSGSYAMAGWATLKFLGREGFQSVLGGILEVEKYLRERIKEEEDMVCVNEPDHGFVTLFRIYPKGTNAEEQYKKELTNPEARKQLVASNLLQENVADALWKWFRSGKQYEGMYGPYTSYTSGFRPTDYNDDFSDPDAVIYAIKSFPMNVNITPDTMDKLIEMVKIARDKVVDIYEVPEDDIRANCPPPYHYPNPAVVCGEEEGTPVESQIGTLLSGVGKKRKAKKDKKEQGCNC